MAENAKKNNVGVIFTILVGFSASTGATQLQLSQLNKVISDLKKDLVAHKEVEGHAKLAQAVVSLKEKLGEVETQFRWASDVINILRDYTERFLAMVWKKVFEVDLPPLRYEPLRIDGE